jgi:hypothetical protein
MENRSLRDVGGTPGGLGHFLAGFAMTCVAGYLLSDQVSVVGSYWSYYAHDADSFCGWAWIHGARTLVVSWAEHPMTTSIATERHRSTLLAHKH